MDVLELATIQKNITKELLKQMNGLNDRISLEQRASCLMFGLLLTQLEAHSPEIRGDMKQQLAEICARLNDPMTDVAADMVRKLIG